MTALTEAGRALHGLPAPNPAPDALRDAVLSAIRKPIQTFGLLVAGGGFSHAQAAEHVLDALYSATKAFPSLAEDVFDLEDEAVELLADAAAAAERDLARRRPKTAPARDGLPAYYAPITESRGQALRRQRAIIKDTILEVARIASARRELRRRRDAELTFLDAPTPAEKAAVTRRLHRQVAAERGFGERIPVAPLTLLSGSMGTGKTDTAAEVLAMVRELIAVRFALPTVEKCDEAAATYAKAAGRRSLPHLVVRGRRQDDPARRGKAMCERHEAAEAVSRAGLPVSQVMCATCPLAAECGYLKQSARIAAMDGVGVFFMASEGLFATSPAPAADLLIGDERIDAADAARAEWGDLVPDVLPYRGGTDLPGVMAAHSTIEAVAAALAAPRQLDALRAAGVDRGRLRAAIRLLEPIAEPDASAVSGARSDAEILRAIERLPDNRAGRALAVLRAVAGEIDLPRPLLNGVWTDREDVRTARLRRVQGIAGAGVLLLDGTGDPDLNRAVFGARLRHEQVRVERDAHVTGTAGKGYSRQSLTGEDAYGRPVKRRRPGGRQGDHEPRVGGALEAAARRLRAEAASIAARLPAPCLVVAAMAAEAALQGDLDHGTPTAHFGALRGLNAYAGCASALVLGQVSMSVGDIEAVARAYLADDPEPFISADVPMPKGWRQGWPYVASRMRRMRDGSLSSVEVEVHPDPRVQRVLEQIREAEVLQAVDRVRPVFNRRDLVLANSLALDITYDRVLTHADLVAGGTRWHRAMAATGILPLYGADLHHAHGDLFSTAKAADRAIQGPGGKLPKPQIETLFEPWVIKCAYRKAGQRQHQHQALIDARRHPDPRAALSALLGALVWFEVLTPAQPAPPQPAVATAPPRPIRVPHPAPLPWDDPDDGWLPVIPLPDWLPQRIPWAAAGASP